MLVIRHYDAITRVTTFHYIPKNLLFNVCLCFCFLFTNIVKATMPLFTVILTRIFFKEKQATSVYLSLVPIITGVGIATMTEISFDMLGLVCALFATLGFSIQNILSKKVLKDTGIHHLRLLHLLGRLALFLFLPVWFYFDFTKIIQEPTIVSAYYSLGKINVINILNGLQRKRLSFNRHL